jgi:hypothetical protein
MTDYFDIEYRKKCRKKLVDSIYGYLTTNTKVPHRIWAFVIKSCHFLISYVIVLLTLFAPLPIGFIMTGLSIITFGLFFYFKGCFVSQLEYKLHDKDFINIVDPYLTVVGWDINDENRYTITMYVVYLYFAILFSILYWRMNR